MARSDDELRGIVERQIGAAVGFLGGEITEDRRRAMRDYLGEPIGNEIEGRSQVVSSDVQDVIETMMPDLMQIFTSSNKAVRFDPNGAEDEEFADIATDYVNFIWNKDNQGFNVFHDWFKDALIQINGIIKIWWDESEIQTREAFTGLDDDALALLDDDPSVEIIESEEVLDEEAVAAALDQGFDVEDPALATVFRRHNVTVIRTEKPGRIKVVNVPPEEFLISRRARSLDDAPFVAHRVERTVSELIEMGYSPEQVKGLPTDGEHDFNEERVERFHRDDERPFEGDNADESMREILVYECFIRVDHDGDGIAELRKVTVAGPGYEILRWNDGKNDNEAVDDHPFAAVTPIRMPHKFFGRSIADLVSDIQMIKTSIWRQLLDNMYLTNNGRAALSNKVDLDDYLDNKVGAPIRVDTDAPDAGGHIIPIQTPSIGPQAYPLLEYVDTVRETRTGVNRLGQGLDPNALNSTASGINQLLGRAQQRMLLIAQVFANGGVRDAFRKILKLVVTNQEESRIIRLRNKPVEIDPREWNADMDVTINVGLGRGTQDQRIVAMTMLQQQMDRMIALQGGVSGPLVRLDHVKNAFDEFSEAVGLKSTEAYVEDVTPEQGQQFAQAQAQQPSPEVAEVQAKNQLAMMELQLKHQRELQALGMQEAREQAKLDLEAAKAAADIELEQEKAQANILLQGAKD